jgi:transcriptional regulator with XRE-family HTH domain
MKSLKEKLAKITGPESTAWREKAEFRFKNRKWLEYSSEIAVRILSAIEDREDLSQTKLAELINVTPQYISKILKGQENLTLETIAKLSEALNVELICFPHYKYMLPIKELLQQKNSKAANKPAETERPAKRKSR